MILNATDDKERPFYWRFMYKVAGKSTTDDGHKVIETNYSYFAVNTSYRRIKSSSYNQGCQHE
jgi:hypothetical protein